LYRDEVIVLQAGPNFLTVNLQEEEITVELLRETLPPVLRVRINRSLFLVDNSAVDDNASLFLEKELEKLPAVDRICIIDPKHPPAWYPPKPYRGPASGGAKMALADARIMSDRWIVDENSDYTHNPITGEMAMLRQLTVCSSKEAFRISFSHGQPT
jgi:hypothetical protein